jgi:hypothetical protein
MHLKDYYILLTRLFLGYVFFSSGLCKLADGHFGQLIGPPNIISELEHHHLAGFGFFLAFSQVMIGAMVLSQRWSLAGLIMLVPMNACILAATLSMQWQGTPFVNGFLLILNILALIYEWKTLRFFLLPEITEIRIPTRTQQLFPGFWPALGVLIAAFLAAITAGFSNTWMMITGISVLLLAWYNAWQSIRITWLARIPLAASLLAIVSLSLTEPLAALEMNVNLPLITGIALTVIATAATTLIHWFSKDRQML